MVKQYMMNLDIQYLFHQMEHCSNCAIFNDGDNSDDKVYAAYQHLLTILNQLGQDIDGLDKVMNRIFYLFQVMENFSNRLT